MNNFKTGILTFLLIALGVQVSAQTSYREAKARLRQNAMPDFVRDQIERASAAVPHPGPLPGGEGAARSVLSLNAENRQPPDNDLRNEMEQLEPQLFTREFIEVQQQAQRGDLNWLGESPVELEALLAVTFARSPQIQNASQAYQAARQRYGQAAYLEGLLRQFNAFHQTLDLITKPIVPQKERINEQHPYPGVTAWRGRVVDRDVYMARMDYLITARDVLHQTKKVFFDYIHHLKIIDITQENQSLLNEMLQVASRMFQAGNSSYNDVLKARESLAKIGEDLQNLKNELHVMQVRLNEAMDRPPQAPLARPAVLHMPAMTQTTKTLQALALDNRYEIRRQEAQIQKLEDLINWAWQMNRPDNTLGASYFENRSALLAGGLAETEGFQPAPRIPLNTRFGEREAYIREMVHRQQEAQQRLQALRNNTRTESEAIFYRLDDAQRQIRLYQTTLLPDARQSLQVAERDYQSGRIGFLDYLDAQQTWLRFNTESHDFMHHRRVALIDLHRLISRALAHIQ